MPGAPPRLPFIPPAAPCGGLSQMLQVVLAQAHMPPTLRHFRPDQGEQILRVGGGLDIIGAVLVHQVKAILGHAPELMHVRRGVVGEAAVLSLHLSHLRP